MVGVAENYNVHVTLKHRCSLKKLAIKSCVGGNDFKQCFFLHTRHKHT